MRLLIFILGIFTVVDCVSQAPTKGLIAYYPFNGNALDKSGNNNTGMVKNGVTTDLDRFGNGCGALRFNGHDGFISVPNSSSLSSPVTEITICTWIKLESGSKFSNKWLTIVCKGNLSKESPDCPHYRLQSTPTTVSISTDFTELLNHNINFDQWYFYTMVYNGSQVKIYLNDREIFNFSYSGRLVPNNLPLEIGRDVPGNLEILCGSLDDLRIYNRALTRTEVLSLYQDNSGKNFTSDFIINCPQNISVPNDPGKCYANVSFANPSLDITCGDATTKQVSGLKSGSQFSVGGSSVNYLATSGSKKKTCSFKIIVEDNEAPTIGCPSDIFIEVNDNSTGARIDYPAVIGNDNCPNYKISRISGNSSGSIFPIGTTLVQYHITDNSGNNAKCSFKVNVIKDPPPIITCPKDIYKNSEPGKNGAIVNYSRPTAFDEGASIAVKQIEGFSSGSFFPQGVTTITYEAIDGGGNKVRCSFKIIVKDITRPQITCPESIKVNCETGKDYARVKYQLPTAYDGGSKVNVELVAGFSSGEQFPVGLTSVKFKAVDNAGNQAFCSFNVEVACNEDWSIKCPQVVEKENDAGRCGAQVEFKDPAVLNSTQPIKLTQLRGLKSNSFFEVGSTINSFIGIDPSNNSKECSFDIKVIDTERPRIQCPNDTIVQISPTENDIKISYPYPNGFDNCTVINVDQIMGKPSGEKFPIGIHKMEFQATDQEGNSSNCDFRIIVLQENIKHVVRESDRSIEGDPIEFQDSTQLNNCFITLLIYDNASNDNDTVSIDFNGIILVDKEEINNKNRKGIGNFQFELTLLPKKPNYLAAKAWNFGKIRPNTLMIEIFEGHDLTKKDFESKKSSKVRLHSAPGHAGGLVINCHN